MSKKDFEPIMEEAELLWVSNDIYDEFENTLDMEIERINKMISTGIYEKGQMKILMLLKEKLK